MNKHNIVIITGGYLDCFIEVLRLMHKYGMDYKFDTSWIISFLEVLYANEDGTIFTGKKGIDDNYINRVTVSVPDDMFKDFVKDLEDNSFEFEVLSDE